MAGFYVGFSDGCGGVQMVFLLNYEVLFFFFAVDQKRSKKLLAFSRSGAVPPLGQDALKGDPGFIG